MDIELQEVSEEELTAWLSDLIQIDTTNPPGNETQAVNYLTKILDSEGIEYQIFEQEEGRSNLFVRIQGVQQPAKYILSAHLDVVPVEEAERQKWKHPPFSGKMIEGEIWGRGAIDDKGMVAMIMGVLIELKRRKSQPPCDVTALFLADEEVGGTHGAEFVASQHPELFDCQIVLNEAGGLVLERNNKKLLLLNNSEKSSLSGYLDVFGKPGHGSMPKTADNAIYHAADIIQDLRNHHTRIVPEPDVLNQIEKLGGGRIGRFLLSHQITADFLLDHPPASLKEDTAYIDAMLRPTITPTIVEGGNKINMVPGHVRIYLDCRLLPGQSWQDVEREISRALGNKYDYNLVQNNPTKTTEGGRSELTDEIKDEIETVLDHLLPGTEVIPFQTMGASDNRFFRSILDLPSFGLFPLIVDDIKEYTEMFHGRNERISIDNLVFGTQLLLGLALQDF